jgi:hypothetical protein
MVVSLRLVAGLRRRALQQIHPLDQHERETFLKLPQRVRRRVNLARPLKARDEFRY